MERPIFGIFTGSRLNYFEKMALVPLVGACVAYFSDAQVLTAYIVIGLGHILISHLYRFRGRVLSKGILLPCIAATAACFFLSWTDPNLFTVATLLFFMLHFFFDEIALAGERPDFLSGLVVFFAVAMFVSLLVDDIYGTDVYGIFSTLGMVIFISTGVLLYWKKQSFSLPVSYIIIISIVPALLDFIGTPFSVQKVFGFIILNHYLHWYVKMTAHFKARGTGAFNTYIWMVLGINALFLGGFYLFLTGPEQFVTWLGRAFYLPPAFYAWTMMHVLTTIRFSDYKAIYATRPALA